MSTDAMIGARAQLADAQHQLDDALAAGGDTMDTAPHKMIELEKVVSDELQENVRKTLIPYLGANNFEISVTTPLTANPTKPAFMPRNGSCRVQIRAITTTMPATSPAITGRTVTRRADKPSTVSGERCATPS